MKQKILKRNNNRLIQKPIKEAYSIINKREQIKNTTIKEKLPIQQGNAARAQKSKAFNTKPHLPCDQVLSHKSNPLSGLLETKPKDMTLIDNNNIKEDVLINSQSTRDPKSSSIPNINPKMIYLDFLNEDIHTLEKLKESESSCNIIENQIHNSETSANNQNFDIVNGSNQHQSKLKEETETSNFLNYNLCDSKSFTPLADISLFDKKEATILTYGGSKFNSLPIIDETEKFEISDDFTSSELNGEDNEIDLSTITAKLLPSYPNPFARIKRRSIKAAIEIFEKKIGNIADSLGLLELNTNQNGNSNNSNYCTDTNEFDSNMDARNIVYASQVQENFLKSHLDVVNLKFLMRYIFHKKSKVTQKSTRNNCRNNIINTDIYDESKDFMNEESKDTIQEALHWKKYFPCTETKEEETRSRLFDPDRLTSLLNERLIKRSNYHPSQVSSTVKKKKTFFTKKNSNIKPGQKPEPSGGMFLRNVVPHNSPKDKNKNSKKSKRY